MIFMSVNSVESHFKCTSPHVAKAWYRYRGTHLPPIAVKEQVSMLRVVIAQSMARLCRHIQIQTREVAPVACTPDGEVNNSPDDL